MPSFCDVPVNIEDESVAKPPRANEGSQNDQKQPLKSALKLMTKAITPRVNYNRQNSADSMGWCSNTSAFLTEDVIEEVEEEEEEDDDDDDYDSSSEMVINSH
jgi:hypothetical protein